MKLGDALAGVKPTSAPLEVNRRVHRLDGGDEDPAPATTTDKSKESDMPKGVYARKPKTSSSTPPGTEAPRLDGKKPARKRKAKKGGAKKARAPKATGRSLRAIAGELARHTNGTGDAARFGVFSDGTVQIDAPSCKGNLSGKDVDLLYAFVSKLREVRK